MSSNQDRSDVNRRPMMWIYGTGFVLLLPGFLITLVTPPSPVTWSRARVGIVLVALSALAILTIPGVLLAMRHPWRAVYRRHPRLYGLAEVWAGLVLSGSMSAILLVPDPFSPAPYWLPASNWFLALGVPALAVALVTLASLMAFYLFDCRR